MEKDQDGVRGACHCGTVQFLVRLTDGLNTARRCNCSYCRMRGAIAVSATLMDIEILEGIEALILYQFNTMEAKHYFCSKCGILRITSVALTQRNMESMLRAWRALAHLILKRCK